MTQAPVLVTGATGQIGYSVLQLCAARGIPVVAVSRNARPSWAAGLNGVRWVQHDSSVSNGGLAPTRLVHCGPLDLATGVVAALPGLRRSAAFSSTSVCVKQSSADPRERAIVARLLDAEAGFTRICEDRGVDWTLMRPTLIYGCGMDQNLTRVARWATRTSLFPLAHGGCGLRQPVHAGDLAEAALAALERPESAGRTYVLAGGTTLSYRDMVAEVYRSVGRSPRFIPLPAGLLAGLVRLARGPSPAMAGRMGEDLIFDDTPAREALGYAPRPFAPEASTWRQPARESAPESAGRSA